MFDNGADRNRRHRRATAGRDAQLNSKSFCSCLVIVRMAAMILRVNIAQWVSNHVLVCHIFIHRTAITAKAIGTAILTSVNAMSLAIFNHRVFLNMAGDTR